MALAEKGFPPVPAPDPPPPLENGDHLTREEFERRYAAMPDLKKAELLEGVVYVPSPVRQDQHSQPHADLGTWMGVYRARTPGVGSGDNATVRLGSKSEPQPDLLLFLPEDRGGQGRISDDDYLVGGPELVAEIASSSVSYDLHEKMDVYRQSAVREYLVWRVRDGAIDWFALDAGQYQRLSAGEDGIHRSRTFPGLWLDTGALLRGDLARVHDVLAEGIASPEHAASVERLAGR